MEERKYFICWINLNRRNIYLIWYSDEIDGVVLGRDKKLLSFSSKDSLRTYAKELNINLQDEKAVLHNLHVVQKWLRNPTRKIDCFETLAAWNLFTDISASLKLPYRGNKRTWVRNLVYDKLFFGNNLPSITPTGKEYFPKWSLVEIAVLSAILKDGFQILQRNLKSD